MKEVITKITEFIRECKEKQYDNATIVEMLENRFILEDLLEHYEIK